MSKQKNIAKHIKQTARFTALEVLTKISNHQAYSNVLINEAIKKNQLSDKDARLMTEIVYGTISRKLTLEYYLAPFIKKAKKVDEWVKQLLYLSMYQMIYLDKVPEYGIFNDAVTIAKAKGNPGIGKFVNGVLRTIQREGVPSLDEIKDDVERLSIEISMPLWLTKRLIDDIGIEETKLLGESLLTPSHVSARIDTRFVSRKDAVETLQSEGIDVSESQVSPYGVVAEKGFLASSELFKNGEMTIQDESSMLVAPAMQIEENHQVLDACAAPGGKTTHIATFLNSEKGGKVVSLDIHEHKIKLIESNASRLHVQEVVEAKLLDAREVKTAYPDDTFDRVLIDAPCSGLGLLRRKPDIKYHKSPEDFMNLQRIQLEILESIMPKVKQWGIITYSTCTLTHEENKDVVAIFLNKHPEFELIDVFGATELTKSYHDKQLQLYPHHYHTDGFFISCLQRKA